MTKKKQMRYKLNYQFGHVNYADSENLLFSSCLSVKCILDLLDFLLDFAYHFFLIKYFISFIKLFISLYLHFCGIK